MSDLLLDALCLLLIDTRKQSRQLLAGADAGFFRIRFALAMHFIHRIVQHIQRAADFIRMIGDVIGQLRRRQQLHCRRGVLTGLRRDQWATRSNIRKIELDHDHGGIVKVNPLADWTDEEVWDYIRDNEVPYHPLYDQGYQSIGCAPCTRPVAPGASARSGRWWWEKDGPKECGMHCAVETGGFEHELEVLVGHGRP